jgi:TRAP-type uncharacterized transport system fused permease subunit
VLGFLVWGLVVMRWERLTPYYAAALLIALTFVKRTSFILGGLMATGVAPAIAAELVQMGGSSVVLILAIGIGVCMIFGMLGLIVAAYLMLALTLAPALEQAAGLNTLAVHLFIAYYATLAAITPPVALAAFLASRISGSDPIRTSWHAARLGIVLYFIPIFFLFEPALILQGPWQQTVVWTLMNVIAIVFIAGASEGYLYRLGRLRGWARWVLFTAGLLIGFPEWVSSGVGLAMVIAVLALARWSVLPRPAPGAARPA